MEKFINILADLWHNLYNSNNGILGTLNGHVVGRAAGLMRECRLGFTVQAESGQVEKRPWTASRKLSKKGSTQSPQGLFFQSITSVAHSLFPTLWSLYIVLFFFISIYSACRGLFFSASLTSLSLSHSRSHTLRILSLSLALFYIWPIIRLKNTQLSLFWYNECSPSLVNPSLKRQFTVSLSSALLLSVCCDWSFVGCLQMMLLFCFILLNSSKQWLHFFLKWDYLFNFV